jgi:hypothetical protein
MFVPPIDSWKLVLAIALFAGVVASVRVRPPRQAIPASELRRLVLGALALYGVGIAASLSHHIVIAVILYSCGIALSALAAWFSRANTGGEPRREEEPADGPPPGPDGAPHFDWSRFEREFEDYVRREREREPVNIN